MQAELTNLSNLGPNVAVLMATGGLTFGMFGWRAIRYLAVIDALLIGLLIGIGFFNAETSPLQSLVTRSAALVMVLGLPWLAWRFHRASIVLLGGAVGFAVSFTLLTGCGMPATVVVLAAGLTCTLAVTFHLTLRQEAAIVTTGLHGGYLCLAALIVASADPRSFGARLLDMLSYHDLLIPSIGLVLSAILIFYQWADLQQSLDPWEGL